VTWECAECNRQSRIDGVCHHCGKPLCRSDQVLIADDAFAASSGEASKVAVHCRACRRQHHPAGVPLGRERP
jgi:5-methylcytosine-specific restriction endonuclease McrA